ncbi:MAG TPA: hypothetical protein VFA15_01150, partial [Nitrososphaera sp.]|nr:hypothetical protein [Nitrososphaera sp.]
AQKALVVEGGGIGKTILVCANGTCKDHFQQRTEYALSPEEKERRKKERERQQNAREKADAKVATALQKVKWPFSEKHLDELLELTFMRCSTSFQMPVVKRHGLKPDVKKQGSYTMRDYEAPLRRLAKEGGNAGKLRMIFELLLPNSTFSDDELKKHIGKL